MTYATQKLTESLQELTERTSQKGIASAQLPELIPSSELQISEEVLAFLQMSRDYARRTEKVSIGSY